MNIKIGTCFVSVFFFVRIVLLTRFSLYDKLNTSEMCSIKQNYTILVRTVIGRVLTLIRRLGGLYDEVSLETQFSLYI